jgi:hypothetical protein
MRLPVSPVIVLFSLLVAICCTGVNALAQVTITSSSRTASLQTAAGNANASSNAFGAWQPILTVGADPSSATIDSDVSPAVIRLIANWSSLTPPSSPLLPGFVAQAEVRFTVAASTQLTFSRTDSGPATGTLQVFTLGGTEVLPPGQVSGSLNLLPDTYVLTYTLSTPSLNSGTNGFNIFLGTPPPPPPSPFAFTYQGRLSRTGAPLPGAIDIQYAFFTDATGSIPVPNVTGGTVTNVGVTSEGLFTTTIDPAEILSVLPAFLELRIRPTGSGAFETLSPRTVLTATPRANSAIKALLADEATLARSLTSRDRINVGGNVFASDQTPGVVLRSPGNTTNEVGFMGMRDELHIGLKSPTQGWGLVMNTANTLVGIGRAYGDASVAPGFDLHVRGITDTQVAITGAPSGRTWALQSSAGNYTPPGSQLNGSFQIIDRTDNVARVLIDANGNMGVGTTTPQQRLDVAGSVRTNTVVYNTPVTAHFSVGDAAWRPRSGSSAIITGLGLGTGGAVLTPGDQFGAVAELQLPHGATIQSITCHFTDNDAAQDLNFALLVNTFTSYVVNASLGTSSASAAGARSFTSTAVAGTVVNNAANYYQIRCMPVGNPFGQWTNNLAIRGVVVTYTLPGPGH